MFVVFIHGPAAAGKYTIGTRVAAELDVPLFHNHLTVDLALALFDFGTPPFRNLRAAIWKAAFEECARAGQSFVFTFHPEATVEPMLVDELAGIVKTHGGKIFFVELQCSRGAVLQRLSNESRRQFGKMTDPALYQAIEAQGGFEFNGMPVSDLQVDTEALEPARAAAVIVETVRGAD